MPMTGALRETLHIPGRLFSVSPWAVRAIQQLFARNERLVCHFDTAHGPLCVVMVGAMQVSGVETVWGGEEIPPYDSRPRARDWCRSEEPTTELQSLIRNSNAVFCLKK